MLSNNLPIATRVQQALSLATNNTVTKQSIIQQACAVISDFDSFEEAMALTDREHLIKNRLWFERDIFDEVVIHAGQTSLTLNLIHASEIVVSTRYAHTDEEKSNDDDRFGIALNPFLTGTAVFDKNITYNHQLSMITILVGGETIEFHRINHSTVSISAFRNNKRYLFETLKVDGSDLAMSDQMDVTRLLAKFLTDISLYDEATTGNGHLVDLDLDRETIDSALDTARYIRFDLADEGEPKPDNYNTKLLGLVIAAFEDTYITKQNLKGDFYEDMLDDNNVPVEMTKYLFNMARNEKNCYLFTHYNK